MLVIIALIALGYFFGPMAVVLALGVWFSLAVLLTVMGD